MNFTIYQINNTVNKKSYIGITNKTPERRLAKHWSRAGSGEDWVLYRAMRKYGKASFLLSILENGDDYKFGLEREKYWISVLKPEYNMTEGGGGVFGYHHTQESKNKISEGNKGKKRSIEYCISLSQRQTGKKRSIETILKCANSNRHPRGKYKLKERE